MMLRVRWLMLLGVVGASSGCSCGPQVCTTRGGGFGGAGGGTFPGRLIGFVGQKTDVQVDVVPTLSGCSDPAMETVTSISVEVLDPADQKVAATATPPVQANGDVTSTVSFTPATPGPYHVTARFLPNGGTVQRDVQVAVDKQSLSPNTVAL